MREQVLENYGVRVTATARGVRYVLPRMKDTSRKASVRALFFGVLPCLAAAALPAILLYRMRWDGTLLVTVFGRLFIACWWFMSIFFVWLFGAMAYSDMTRWGRARIWVTLRRIAAVQLRGENSHVAHVHMERVRGFSTIVDGEDRANSATPGRLVVDLDNNVSRLVGGYPLELLEALKVDLEVRVEGLRQLRK